MLYPAEAAKAAERPAVPGQAPVAAVPQPGQELAAVAVAAAERELARALVGRA